MDTGRPYRAPKPERVRRRPAKEHEGPETLEETIEALDEELGAPEERHQKMLHLLRQRRVGDQKLAPWIRTRKSEGLVELYIQLDGVTGDDLLLLLIDLDDTTSGAVVRRIEETFSTRARQMSAENIIGYADRFRYLTEIEVAALRRGKHKGLVAIIEKHTSIVQWATAPTSQHLEKLYRSARESQEVYWTLLEDHMSQNTWNALSFGDDGRLPFEQLLEMAESIRT